jgi:putative transposase
MKRHPFPTDLSDAQWAVIAPLLPPPGKGGRRRRVDLREVVNAIRFLLAHGCGWRNLPDCFPNRSTVRHYFDTWRKSDVWDRVEAALANSAIVSDSLRCPVGEEAAKREGGTS